MNDQIFQRTEKKYLVSFSQRQALLNAIGDRMQLDPHGEKTISSIYFDTDSFDFIRRSLEKPVYKEKLRLRAYGKTENESEVYIELKKKYRGVVYKRRQALSCLQALEYARTRVLPFSTQILREIDYVLQSNPSMAPRALISYRRLPLFCREDHDLRMTFDQNLLYRREDLDFRSGVYGLPVLSPDLSVLEIKALHALPLWLVHELDRLKIYPQSFSKYGTAYQKYILPDAEQSYASGGFSHVVSL